MISSQYLPKFLQTEIKQPYYSRTGNNPKSVLLNASEATENQIFSRRNDSNHPIASQTTENRVRVTDY